MNKVILLIPHYNNIEGLKKSLSSIDKTEKLDILIVDDGSNILFSENELKQVFKANGEVCFLYQKINKGIEYALNKGLEFIIKKKYTYTARLDCGDVCVGKRFLKQETFLENNKDIYLLGSNVEFVTTKDVLLYKLKVPTTDIVIRKKMYINAMHIHPTIMFRNSMLKKTGLYPIKYKAAEDYAFFFNVMQKFNVANIDEVLVKCELNTNGISSLQRKQQAKNRVNIILNNFYFGFYPIYGLLRSLLLYIMPLHFLIFLKKTFKK